MNLQTRIPISNGTSIPCVGFGTWKTPNEEAEKSVAEALRVGYRHIDTATAYGNEAGVGKAIAERALAKGITTICFDRGGYLFHGRVKSLADAAREGGLVF